MDTALQIIGWSAFGLAVFVGLALDLVGLFGNWIILAAVVLAWVFSGFEYFGVAPIAIMTALAIAGEVIEMVAAGYGARKFGGSKGAMVAAIVGCIAGAILFTPLIPIPIVGTLVGAISGSFLGAALQEYLVMQREPHEAARVGFGAALGKVAGVFAKLIVGLAMVAVAVVSI